MASQTTAITELGGMERTLYTELDMKIILRTTDIDQDSLCWHHINKRYCLLSVQTVLEETCIQICLSLLDHFTFFTFDHISNLFQKDFTISLY